MSLIDLNRIKLDGGTQTRVALNESVVAEYADALRDGAKLPSIVVFFDGSDHWLADGFHRYHAHAAARKATINVDIRPGTRREAVLFSVGANSTHGLRRTNDDKRRAVKTMLDDAEWSQWSDREIAKQCGVTHPFVAGVRAPKVVTVTTQPPVDNFAKKQEEPSESPSVEPEKAGQKDTPVFEENEDENAIIILAQENEDLRARLAVGVMVGTDEEKLEAADTIADLRQQVKTLSAENVALRASRDHYQSEASQLRKQIKLNEKELKKARAVA